MTIIGATHKIVGRSCMIDENILPANINQNIALIRANKLKVSPYYLNVFLHTRYGKDFLRRLSRQTEQVNLNCEEVGKISIVRFSPKFENIIVENLKKSYLLTEPIAGK
jgi:type I restriction enzyme S subunit